MKDIWKRGRTPQAGDVGSTCVRCDVRHDHHRRRHVGLAAGIRLAYYDQRVCILERHYTIGGLNSFYRLRGRDYDVGLHAVTNFTPKGASKGPLARLLRQLRFHWDDFALSPQIGSTIAFPDVRLRFRQRHRAAARAKSPRVPRQNAIASQCC